MTECGHHSFGWIQMCFSLCLYNYNKWTSTLEHYWCFEPWRVSMLIWKWCLFYSCNWKSFLFSVGKSCGCAEKISALIVHHAYSTYFQTINIYSAFSDSILNLFFFPFVIKSFFSEFARVAFLIQTICKKHLYVPWHQQQINKLHKTNSRLKCIKWLIGKHPHQTNEYSQR